MLYIGGVDDEGDEWTTTRGGSIMKKISPRLEITLYREKKFCNGTMGSTGPFGPVYALLRVEDLELPLPVERELEDFNSPAECKGDWARYSATEEA